VRQAAQAFSRRFAVVRFECPAAKEVSLRRIFYEQVQDQLEERYDIEIDAIDLQRDYDNKANMARIVAQIKDADPERGLVVIIDEISDFLKQKERTDMTYDLNFLRELGEVSQDTDFVYIGAMQEHVFTNPKYVDQAENISRITQRFTDITITKDDIARVLSERVVRKTSNQRVELESLLDSYQQYFTNLTAQMSTYLDLYPVHPYVISVFGELPYFEQRGVINFASDNVRAILDQEAPVFITYDRVYDQIDQIHEIRNLPEVSQVLRAARTLDSKADLLDARLRADARKLIKALAVLKMLGGSEPRGATAQELANTLFILPASRTILDPDLARDNIDRILIKLRSVANGQYLTIKDGTYYLVVEDTPDFDVLIQNRIDASGQPDFALRFRKLMEEDLEINEATTLVKEASLYDDTAAWTSRKSFRRGYILIGSPRDVPPMPPRDFSLILQSPFADHNPHQMDQNQLIVGAALSPDLLHRLQRVEAAMQLARAGQHRKTFEDIAKREGAQFRSDYLAWLIQEGYVVFGGVKRQIKEVPAGHYGTLSDLLDHLKSYFFEGRFAEAYPQYPTFRKLLSARNIQSEIHQAIQALDKSTLLGLDYNAQSYLEGLGVWQQGRFDPSNSPIARRITDTVATNDQQGKLTPLIDLVAELGRKPFGLQPELVYLLLAALLYHGEIVFVRQGGARLYAADFSGFSKSGLAVFDEIKYLERERDLDVAKVSALFEALGLQSGLVKDKASRGEAVKALHERVVELRGALDGLKGKLVECLKTSSPDIPWSQVQIEAQKVEALRQPIEDLIGITKVTDLGRITLDGAGITELQRNLQSLAGLGDLLTDYEQDILPGIRYVQAVSPDYERLERWGGSEGVAELRRIEADAKTIYGDYAKLSKPDQRRPLKGKFAQYRERYKKLYYALHEGAVGNKVPFARLDELRHQARYRALNALKTLPALSPVEFDSLALKAQTLLGYQCKVFNVDDLDDYPVCPHCSFPRLHDGLLGEHPGPKPVTSQIEHLEDAVDELWAKWERQLLQELDELKDKLPLLSATERQLVENVRRSGHFPDEPGPVLLRALGSLMADLVVVECRLDDLRQALLAGSGVLTAAEFDQAVAAFKERLLKGTDPDLARIKIV